MSFEEIINTIFLFLCKYRTIIYMLIVIIVTYYASLTIFNIIL
jgi:hypothetical protein